MREPGTCPCSRARPSANCRQALRNAGLMAVGYTLLRGRDNGSVNKRPSDERHSPSGD
jgi:hypothetical protein